MSKVDNRHKRMALSMAHDELLGLYDDPGRLSGKLQARGAESEADEKGVMNALMEIVSRLGAEHRGLYDQAGRRTDPFKALWVELLSGANLYDDYGCEIPEELSATLDIGLPLAQRIHDAFEESNDD